MPRFSPESFSQLSTCHVDLQTIMYETIKHLDIIILEGYRGEIAQNKAVEEGRSTLLFPHGKHNAQPSMAVDIAPYEKGIQVDWQDSARFTYFAGYIMAIAQLLKDQGKITHSIRWGGDWNQDTELKDEHFRDLGHFELLA